MQHTSVLLHEVLEDLEIKSGDVIVDGTLGGGGHTEAVLQKFGSSVKIFAIDQDQHALDRARARLEKYHGDVTYILGNFRDIDTLIGEKILDSRLHGNDGEGSEYQMRVVDKILLDIGMSSNQLEESGRGFSFRSDEPLNMSFKSVTSPDDWTAERIVNTWDADSLETVIKHYGEERFAGRIARAIVRTRELTPIKTTTDLVNIILSATPAVYHRQRLHPATRTFQAFRITVNDELQALSAGVEKGFALLKPSGRLAVISFHSLEDRIVKTYFKKLIDENIGRQVTKKPIVPEENEIIDNPRARSAKLRIIEKI